MIGRARFALWSCLLCAGVAAAIYFAAVPADGPPTTARQGTERDEERRLVPIAMDQVAAITIVHRGVPRHFLRDQAQRWYLHGEGRGHRHEDAPARGAGHVHVADPALVERIDKAFAMFGHTRVERIVDSGKRPDLFGTSNPEMIIALHRVGEALPFRRILVGDVAPDSLARYVLLQEELATVTIPNYQILNLEELLSSVDGSVSGAHSP